MKVQTTLALVAALLVSTIGCQSKTGDEKPPDKVAAAPAKVPTFEMYVMSQCPYGVQVMNAIAPVKEQLGSAVNVKIGYIGTGTPGSFQSLHGPAEVKGNIAQLCAAKQAPDKYLALIVCQNQNARAVDTNWKECAEKSGIDAAKLEACINGDEGGQLLAASFTEAQQRGANGSPTMFIDGKPYDGGRKPKDFLKAVCNATGGDLPQPCRDIPEPPVVHAIFLSDKRCAECNIAQIEPRIKQEVGGLQVQHVDYMSDEGKNLYKELAGGNPQFKMLPAILLDGAEIAKDKDGMEAFQTYMQPVGKWQSLRLNAKFDPTAEICDNSTDDDGDSKTDCADDGCKDAMACREAKAKTLDLFVMSQCPYGAQAMVAANDVVEHFGDDITLNVHFIGEVKGDTLSSMHGQAEVDEDIREICAAAKYGKKHQFMKYLACRSKDYRSGSVAAVRQERRHGREGHPEVLRRRGQAAPPEVVRPRDLLADRRQPDVPFEQPPAVQCGRPGRDPPAVLRRQRDRRGLQQADRGGQAGLVVRGGYKSESTSPAWLAGVTEP